VLPASLRCLLLQLTEFLPIALQKFSVWNHTHWWHLTEASTTLHLSVSLWVDPHIAVCVDRIEVTGGWGPWE
jgi:hypothetical protein